jgi:hypothetical protein
MKVLQSPDMIVSCSLFSLCLSVLLSIVASRTLVVLGVQSLWTSKLLRRNRQNFSQCEVDFNHNSGSPRVSRYSRACPSMLWRFFDENTYKDERGVHERDTRHGSSLTTLCSTRWVELRHQLHGIASLEIKGHAHPSESWACSLAVLCMVPTYSERGARLPVW